MKKPSIDRNLRQWASATALGVVAASAGSASAAEAPAAPPPPKWETSAGLGFTLTAGNSESVLFTGNILTQRKEEKNEYRAGIDIGYGKAKPQESASNPDPGMEKNTDFIRGMAQWNHTLKDKFYSFARAEALHDDIADIMYRVTLSAGAGYYFVKNDKVTLSGEIGPGYVFESLSYKETYVLNPGPPVVNASRVVTDENDYASLRIGERFEYKISATARLWQSAEFIPEVTDFENFLLNFAVGVEADLTKKLAMSVVLSDTYDNVPAPGRKENDLKVVAGLRYKF